MNGGCLLCVFGIGPMGWVSFFLHGVIIEGWSLMRICDRHRHSFMASCYKFG